MSLDFTGTNSEKIDKLVVVVTKQHTLIQVCLGFLMIGLPMLGGLMSWVITESFHNSAKIDRLSDDVRRLSDDVRQLTEAVKSQKSEIDKIKARP